MQCSLVTVPDGDWFCPSCCCGICGQSKLKDGANIVDDSLYTCAQCAHKCRTLQDGTSFLSFMSTLCFAILVSVSDRFLGSDCELEEPPWPPIASSEADVRNEPKHLCIVCGHLGS
ncbi:hypothetical protein V6N11_026350 [Hibiscus sabdariffa]|uniref:Uncharacterized protein n=1 Tax=Hibiscus sabdariffa TaxID=183260 RepID=A0ABR2SW93_9ROSI